MAEGNYKLSGDHGSFPFTVVAGGFMEGENVNGSIQAGKLVATINDVEYDGQFISENTIKCYFQGEQGNGECNLVLSKE